MHEDNADERDNEKLNANVWMIDFVKTRPLPKDLRNKISHFETHLKGDYEDGYLIGLTNLLSIFREIIKEEQQQQV